MIPFADELVQAFVGRGLANGASLFNNVYDIQDLGDGTKRFLYKDTQGVGHSIDISTTGLTLSLSANLDEAGTGFFVFDATSANTPFNGMGFMLSLKSTGTVSFQAQLAWSEVGIYSRSFDAANSVWEAWNTISGLDAINTIPELDKSDLDTEHFLYVVTADGVRKVKLGNLPFEVQS